MGGGITNKIQMLIYIAQLTLKYLGINFSYKEYYTNNTLVLTRE